MNLVQLDRYGNKPKQKTIFLTLGLRKKNTGLPKVDPKFKKHFFSQFFNILSHRELKIPNWHPINAP